MTAVVELYSPSDTPHASPSLFPAIHSDFFDHPAAVPFRATNHLSDILTARAAVPDQPVCIGHGLDVVSLGVLSTIVLPTVIGLVIWVSTFIFQVSDRPGHRRHAF